jgi:UDPglucose 6-dehydrogenase
MKIAIFGSGYVGLVTGACLSNLGNIVTCIDVDEKRIADLNSGLVPIYEPGLKEMIHKNAGQQRLFFTLNAAAAIRSADVIFITVGTPPGPNGKCDLKYVYQVAKTIGEHMNGYKVIVDKSTVPVGTADQVKQHILASQKEKYSFSLVSNPEFLREGEAIKDFMNPDRIVIGVEDEEAKKQMIHIYKGIERVGKPIFATSIKSAELIKYAANAFLATKISFMNEVAQLCERVGGDVKQVAQGIGLDTRIGPRFLQAGIGYGGSCFPKDVQALVHTAQEVGLDFSILRAVHAVNDAQKRSLFPKIQTLLGDVTEKRVAILGLSFKPKTDDIRDAPSLVLMQQLLDAGAIVQAYDPVAMPNMKKHFSSSPHVMYCADAYSAAAGADCLVIVTDWDEFRYLDLTKIKGCMKESVIVDGRNIYDPKDVFSLGFVYIGVGREGSSKVVRAETVQK